MYMHVVGTDSVEGAPRSRLLSNSVLNKGASMSSAVVFDVDGVIVDSPHERAWVEALAQLADGDWRELVPATRYRPEAFDTPTYQAFVAGKPRLDGARAILEHFGFPDAQTRAVAYAHRKQRHLLELIAQGAVKAFPDALRLIGELHSRHVPLAAASSSKNANAIMEKIDLDAMPASAAGAATRSPRTRLLDCFAANVCGQDVAGKPAPDLFLAAAAALGVAPAECIVVEDAPAGVAAARNGGMKSIGIARLHDEAGLAASGADLVVSTLDDVAVDPLVAGRLAARRQGGDDA
jgi:beta-phosphoglucomutase-like phosphatase (HAD superfamily)